MVLGQRVMWGPFTTRQNVMLRLPGGGGQIVKKCHIGMDDMLKNVYRLMYRYA